MNIMEIFKRREVKTGTDADKADRGSEVVNYKKKIELKLAELKEKDSEEAEEIIQQFEKSKIEMGEDATQEQLWEELKKIEKEAQNFEEDISVAA